MKRSFFCIGFVLVSLVAADTGAAHAARPIHPCHEVVIDNLIASCTMQIHHSKPITLQVKSPIIETNKPEGWPVVDHVKPTGDMIVFETAARARLDRIAGIYVIHTRQYTLYMIMSAAPSAEVADHAIVLDHASQLAIFDSAVAAKAREVAASMISEVRRTHAEELRQRDADHAERIARLEETIERLQKYVLEVAEHAIIGAVIQGSRITPIHQELDRSEGFSIRGTEWVEVGGDRILRFDVHNHEDEPFPVTRVQVFNQDGSREHTGTVRIGAESADLPSPKDGPLGVVAPRQDASGAVLIRDHQSLGESVQLMVYGPEGVSPRIRIIPIRPVEPKPEEKQDRQLFIGIRAVAGGCWIPSRIADSSATDATPCGGFAVRVTKGLSELWGVEVEVAGGAIGEARFDNVTISDAMGELSHNRGRRVRVTLGGMLRFGRTLTPVLRLGFTVQGTSYDSQFVVDGTEQPDPDLETDIDTGIMAGAGVSFRLGKNVVVEAGVSTVSRGTNELRALEAGLYAGYGW